jgi:hypothetical protein
MSREKIVRFLAWVVVLAVVFFVFLWIGFAVQARRAWKAGVRAEDEGSEILAQGYYERSIRNHCPFNVWGGRSVDALQRLAKTYEEHGALERALDTYVGLKTALAATDTGWSRSRRDRINRLGEKIASLRADLGQEPEKPEEPAADEAQ